MVTGWGGQGEKRANGSKACENAVMELITLSANLKKLIKNKRKNSERILYKSLQNLEENKHEIVPQVMKLRKKIKGFKK